MALHPLLAPRIAPSDSTRDRAERLDAELADARALLRRLLRAEYRIGLVHLIMDDARRWLARTNRG